MIALFLKDLVHVYEIDRDDPPTSTQLIFTPDNRFGVEAFRGGRGDNDRDADSRCVV